MGAAGTQDPADIGGRLGGLEPFFADTAFLVPVERYSTL